MEKIPAFKNEEENQLTFDETASALEEVIITIANCRRDIDEAENVLKINEEEYNELVGMLDQNDPGDKTELEKINAMQNSFVSTIQQGIARMETIISELESIHGKELKMFEELKAAQRETDFGSSGTAH